MNELEIIKKEIAVIEFNFDDAKKWLSENLEKYKNIVITEDNFMTAKTLKSDITKMKTNIETFRKDTKKELEKPIKEFELKCKELVKMADDVEAPIKEQIQIFDNKRKEEKTKIALAIIEEIKTEFNLKPEYANKIILEPEYSNLTISKTEVRSKVEAVAMTLEKEQKQAEELEKVREENIKIIEDTLNEESKKIYQNISISRYINSLDSGIAISNIIKNIKDDVKAREIEETEIKKLDEQEKQEEENPTADDIAEKLKDDTPVITDDITAEKVEKRDDKPVYDTAELLKIVKKWSAGYDVDLGNIKYLCRKIENAICGTLKEDKETKTVAEEIEEVSDKFFEVF